MFEKSSRYYTNETYNVTDIRGREVQVVVPADDPGDQLMGTHLRKEGQRLDHLAHQYAREATAFWRICEMNDVMLADALTEADEIKIPLKGR
jgi:hypothetical protein